MRPDPQGQDRPIRQRGELPFAAAMLVLSLFLLSQLGTEARWYPRGVQPWAQPAFWPGVGLVGMTVFSALWVGALLRARRPDTEWRELLIWLRAFEYVCWYLAYAFLTPVLGYLAATVLTMVLLVARLGLIGWRSLAAAAAFGVAVVLVFKTGMSVRIPGGLVYDLLPDRWRIFMSQNF